MTEAFNTYVGSLPQAITVNSTDSLYLLQGTTSTYVSISTLSPAIIKLAGTFTSLAAGLVPPSGTNDTSSYYLGGDANWHNLPGVSNPLNLGGPAAGSNGTMTLFGETSGTAEFVVNNTGTLSIASQTGFGLYINDGSNGTMLFVGGAGGTIANKLNIQAALTGNPPNILAVGSDTNVNMLLGAQGSGSIEFSSPIQVNGSSSGSFAISASSTGSPIYGGTKTNDSPPAGNIGEFIHNALGGNSGITCTITIAAPGVITGETGFIPGNYTAIIFATTGSLPTGLTAGTIYYVGNVSGLTFSVATSLANAIAGTFITTSGTQSGTQSYDLYCPLSTGNFQALAAMALTAGDWDVWGIASFSGGSTTTLSWTNSSIGTSSSGGSVIASTRAFYNSATVFNSTGVDSPIIPAQLQLASTTDVYLGATASFGVSTCNAYGSMSARRRR